MKLIKHLFFISLILTSFKLSSTETVKPFMTDGCTMFIDELTIIDKSWHSCCVEHDFRYWIGGEKSKQDYADTKFRECLEVRATKIIAKIMYNFVRLGHHSPVKHSTKWGWGNVGAGDKEFVSHEFLKNQDQFYSKSELLLEL